MIRLSNCKINLGLNLLNRREDGFHNLETVFYPVRGLQDIVEILPSTVFEFSRSGIEIDCSEDHNLCVRAFRLMQQRFGLPDVKLHLHKNIPLGAGLGGGSSNATAVVMLCNDIFELGLNTTDLEQITSELGSDTVFFVHNHAALATGRGEILTPFDINLEGYWLLLVKPDIGVSTAEAYAGITPKIPDRNIRDILQMPIEYWRDLLVNDFEKSIFHRLPLLREIKEKLYKSGAIYAAMSGSGSTIFGIFNSEPPKELFSVDLFSYRECL